MTDNVIRREVQRRDDPFGIPACFYWTMDEVADWVDSIGYGKYKENFRSHFINGRKLLTVDACVLPRMGITHFGDILGLTAQLACLKGDSQRREEGAHVNLWELDDRCSMSHHFLGAQMERPDFRDPWRGHEAHIAARVVGGQDLYLLAAARGYRAPFHFQGKHLS